jgi:co-chaperonin GroES (HSP10)
MPVISYDKTIEKIAQSKDPKRAIQTAVGDLSGCQIRADLVLVGIYIRPDKTSGGIYLSTDTLKEDQYQGKVGVVLKLGPDAHGTEPELSLGDWVVFDVKDGWSVYYNQVACRAVPYERIRMIVDNPLAVL